MTEDSDLLEKFVPRILDVPDGELKKEDVLIPDFLHALIIPLGNSVSAALQILVNKGILRVGQCLVGFPHPAGGNGHRVRQFTEAQHRLMRQVAEWFESDTFAH
jgi:hypothetical protein